jgi:uncharacterized protein
MIGGMFLLFIFADFISSLNILYSDTTLLLGITLSLLFFLLGMHIHFYMVRTGHIPQFIARPARTEFNSMVEEILYHDEFVKLKEYNHHASHIYDHVVRVAFLSYAVSKILRFDYIAAARGGLLHDFFLYDWREKKATDAKRSMHGKEHPHIALENAQRHFEINEREADIIVKHMYPKTRALPRYKESFVVSLMDKVTAIIEYVCHHICKGRLDATKYC